MHRRFRIDPFTLLWQKQCPVGLGLSHVSTKKKKKKNSVCNFLSVAPPLLITLRADLPTEMHNAGAPPSIMQHLFIPQQYLIDLILFASCIIEQTGPRVRFLPASGCCHRPRSIIQRGLKFRNSDWKLPFLATIVKYRYVRLDGWMLSFIEHSKASAAKCLYCCDALKGIAWIKYVAPAPHTDYQQWWNED